jgi:hypothetical protein
MIRLLLVMINSLLKLINKRLVIIEDKDNIIIIVLPIFI